ncbi:MAG: hypothetical protein OXE82_10145, partial [Rhodobacter sp.]|nr:hypothetical protein [Rhodobacter sp.]
MSTGGRLHALEAIELRLSFNRPETRDISVYRTICGDLDPKSRAQALNCPLRRLRSRTAPDIWT